MVSKNTIIEDSYKGFYDLLQADSNLANAIYPSFPDLNIDQATSKDSYPIHVLNHPEIESEEIVTLTKKRIFLNITFEINTTSPKTTDQKASSATNSIEVGTPTLRALGLKMIEVDSVNSEIIQRGNIKIHQQVIRWKFEYIYTKARTW